MERTKIRRLGIPRPILLLLHLVLAVGSVIGSLEPSVCKKAVDIKCVDGTCDRSYIPVKCYNGHCNDETGDCECSHCWSGSNCDQLENNNAPVFVEKTVEVEVDINSDNDVITVVQARDLDALKCPDDDKCECAKVFYSIYSGNSQSLFMIDPLSGEISLSPAKRLKTGSKHAITITAANEQSYHRRMRSLSVEQKVDKTTILVSVVENVENQAHSRRKRSSDGVPDTPTFEIEKYGEFEDKSEVLVGSVVPMGLVIWLPATITNMTVEVVTENTYTAIMTLCNVSIIHVGSNYPDVDPDLVTIAMDAAAGDYRYDRAVLEFGEVENTGSDTSDPEASKIKIAFDAIMQNNPDVADGDTIYVSGAVDYNEDQSWGGQIPFTFEYEDWVKTAAAVNVEGVNEMSKSSAVVFNFSMELNDPANDVRFDVYTPFNVTSSAFSICRVDVWDKGSSFGCLPDDLPQLSFANESDSNLMASLDFGSITNAGSRLGSSTPEDNTISGEFVVLLTNNTEVINGEKYWLGVSVRVDDEEIYSSQLAVTANPIAPPMMTAEPVIQFYVIDSNEVIIGGSVGFILNVTIQGGVTTALVIDLSMPYSDGEPVMTICSAKVASVGYNMPCVGDAIMDYYQEDGENTDYVQFNFGHVTNTGQRHSDDDNTIMIHVTTKLEENHPAMKPNTTFLVTAGVRYEMANNDVLWVAQNPINTTDDAHDYDQVPTFTIVNRADDQYIYNLSAASFDFEIFVPAVATYEPLTIDISTPVVENKAFVSICRVELIHFGENLACYDLNDMSITYESSENDGINDMATISLGIVSNPEFEDTDENKEGSTIRFEVHVKMEEHVKLEDGMILWTSFGATISETRSWSGQISLIANFARPDLYPDEVEPEYDFYAQSGRSRVLKAGGTAIYYVSMPTEEQSVTAYTLNVTAPNETLSVCRVHMTEAGRNFPCFDLTQKASYLAYEGDDQFDAAVLDLGPQRNTGNPPTDDSNENLMVAQVVVQMRPEALPPDNITLPEDQYFSVAMKTGTQGVWTAEDYLVVNVEPPDLNFTVLPEFTFDKLSSEPTITIGGSAVFYLDMYIPYGTIADYMIQFDGDVTEKGKTQICDAKIVATGWNVPCVNGSHVGTEFVSTYDNDIYDYAYTDYVTITNMNLYGTLSDDVNKVRVQLIAQLADNDTIADGDEFWLGATVSVNDGNMWLLQKKFTANKDLISEETQGEPMFDLIPPYENVTMTIGSEETYMMNITMPPMSTPMVINISLPVIGDEAQLTISDVQLIYVGKNFACGQFWELDPVYISDTDTSQNTTAVIDLGIVMNHGTSRYYQYNEYEYDDDEFHLTVTIQLTDHIENTNHTTVPFNVSFHYSDGRSVTLNESIEVLVLGNEQPELTFNLTVEEFDPADMRQGDILDVTAMLQHTNTSTAHAHAIRINLMIPDYIEFNDIFEFEGPEPCVTTGLYGVQWHFDEFFFTDYFWFRFNLTLDPLKTIEIGSGFVNTTIPYDSVYYQLESIASDGGTVLGQGYQTETEILDLIFNVDECYDVIGLATFDACQFSASTYSDTYSPSEVLFDTGSGWGSAVRDMAPYKGNDYVQVSFGDIYRVSGITVQWGTAEALYVTEHRMQYSHEGLVWHDYEEGGAIKDFVSVYNESYTDPWTTHYLNVPFEAEYVRILPTEYEAVINNTLYYPILRFQLLGCIKQNNPATDMCTSDDIPDFGHYERGYIVDPIDGTVFVCILEYINGPIRCSFSRDKGESWHATDTNVGNIVAIVPETREIYGIAQNKRAMMRSDDFGETWYSINVENYFDKVEDSSVEMLPVEEVPFTYVHESPDKGRVFTDNSTIDELYQWTAAKAGIYRRQQLVEVTTIVSGNDTTVFTSTSFDSWTLIGEWTYPDS